MKKLLAVLLALLCLSGCVEKKAPETLAPTETTQAIGADIAVPSPEDMPDKAPENTLPPGEDNIPDETHTH